MLRPRITQTKAPRAPSLRSLVRLALKCDSAEELNKRLKRRYDHQQQRQGIKTGRVTAADEAEHEQVARTTMTAYPQKISFGESVRSRTDSTNRWCLT